MNIENLIAKNKDLIKNLQLINQEFAQKPSFIAFQEKNYREQQAYLADKPLIWLSLWNDQDKMNINAANHNITTISNSRHLKQINQLLETKWFNFLKESIIKKEKWKTIDLTMEKLIVSSSNNNYEAEIELATEAFSFFKNRKINVKLNLQNNSINNNLLVNENRVQPLTNDWLTKIILNNSNLVKAKTADILIKQLAKINQQWKILTSNISDLIEINFAIVNYYYYGLLYGIFLKPKKEITKLNIKEKYENLTTFFTLYEEKLGSYLDMIGYQQKLFLLNKPTKQFMNYGDPDADNLIFNIRMVNNYSYFKNVKQFTNRKECKAEFQEALTFFQQNPLGRIFLVTLKTALNYQNQLNSLTDTLKFINFLQKKNFFNCFLEARNENFATNATLTLSEVIENANAEPIPKTASCFTTFGAIVARITNNR